MPQPIAIRVSKRLPAPATTLFVLVSRYENAVRVIDGLKSMVPAGAQTSGVGARFDAMIRVGPRVVQARVELAEMAEDRLVRWVATEGDDRSILFELKPVAETTTAVRLTITYQRAAGLGASVLAPVVEEAVRSRAKRTLDRLGDLSA
ncbi:MAG: SRPBCC family protein [Acidimicrobiales bacterium]